MILYEKKLLLCRTVNAYCSAGAMEISFYFWYIVKNIIQVLLEFIQVRQNKSKYIHGSHTVSI